MGAEGDVGRGRLVKANHTGGKVLPVLGNSDPDDSLPIGKGQGDQILAQPQLYQRIVAQGNNAVIQGEVPVA